jgi:hypothetical protein
LRALAHDAQRAVLFPADAPAFHGLAVACKVAHRETDRQGVGWVVGGLCVGGVGGMWRRMCGLTRNCGRACRCCCCICW